MKEKLFEAARNGNLKEVKDYLKLQDGLIRELESGNTLLYAAACSGSIDTCTHIVKMMKEFDPKLIDAGKDTPVFAAAKFGHSHVIKLLCENGASVTKRVMSEQISTPLHIATKNGDLESCKHLLKYGADINAFDGAGKTAIYYAEERTNKLASGMFFNPMHASPNAEKVLSLLQAQQDQYYIFPMCNPSPIDYCKMSSKEVNNELNL